MTNPAEREAPDLPSLPVRLAEQVLAMDMATPRGIRARELAREVMAHQDALIHALRLIQHATAPSPDDGGHHEAAHEIATAALEAAASPPPLDALMWQLVEAGHVLPIMGGGWRLTASAVRDVEKAKEDANTVAAQAVPSPSELEARCDYPECSKACGDAPGYCHKKARRQLNTVRVLIRDDTKDWAPAVRDGCLIALDRVDAALQARAERAAVPAEPEKSK